MMRMKLIFAIMSYDCLQNYTELNITTNAQLSSNINLYTPPESTDNTRALNQARKITIKWEMHNRPILR